MMQVGCFYAILAKGVILNAISNLFEKGFTFILIDDIISVYDDKEIGYENSNRDGCVKWNG